MALELKEIDEVPKIPRTKTVFLDGVNIGDVKPSISGDRLNWHACIRLTHPNMLSTFFLQGFGCSPRKAIAMAIKAGRAERDAMIEKIGWLEAKLGTADKSDDFLTRMDI